MSKKTTHIVVSLENRQKLLVIRESVLGLGASFNDVITEYDAVYNEHKQCERNLERIRQELQKLKEETNREFD